MDLIPILAQAAKFLDITLGNILTLGACAASVIMGWQKIRDELGSQKDRMAKIEETLENMKAKGVPTICVMHTERLASIEEKLDALAGVATDVSWIKSTLTQVTQKLDDERRRRA